MPRCFAGVLVFALAGSAAADDLAKAKRLFNARKWVEARESYLAALPELEGNDTALALRQIGYTWQLQGRDEQALPYFHRVLEMQGVKPKHRSAAWLRLGYSLRMLRRGQEGIAALEKAAAVKGAPAAHVAEALLFAAWEHNKRDEQEAAMAKFRRIDDIPGVHANYIATAQLSIGRLLQDEKKYDQAIAAFSRIAELNPVAMSNRSRARVYILECQALQAGDAPFHIRPYVTKVTTTSASIFWVSQGEASPGRLTIAVDKGASSPDQEIQPTKQEHVPEVSDLKGTICHLHKVALEDLRPGVRYRYQVDCDKQQVVGSFKTAPGVDEPFSFSLIGDTQSYYEGLQPLLDAMAAEKTDFVLHVGDITDRGELWGEWKASFFDPGHGYLSNRAFWPAYGNHDGGPYFPALFELQRRYWYSFDWGNAHFIMLDSYGAGSGGAGRREQFAWLKEDLEKSRKRWTFVALHVPMVATRQRIQWFGAEDFLPLLEEHEVDIVFSGHHPHYRRYYPIGSPGKRPILHITSGGGGGPIGGYAPSPLLAQGVNVNHYCKIQINGAKLRLSANAISGAVIDSFEIVKTEPLQLASPGVETGEAKKFISLYDELLSDPAHQLQLFSAEEPQAGETIELQLDLANLPRGRLDPAQFEEDDVLILQSTSDSPWKIESQQFALRDAIGRFRATAPSAVSIQGQAIRPAARVQLKYKKGDRTFEPIEVGAELRIK